MTSKRSVLPALEPGGYLLQPYVYYVNARCAVCGTMRGRQVRSEAEGETSFLQRKWIKDPERGWICAQCVRTGRAGDPNRRGDEFQLVPAAEAIEAAEVDLDKTGAENDLPIVGNHMVTAREWAAFSVYARTGDKEAAAREAGITTRKLGFMQRQDWWVDLWRANMESLNQDLHRKIVEQDPEVIKAYKAIIKGDRAEDRSAAAAGNLIKMRMEIGDRPLKITRPDVKIQQNTINVGGDLTVKTPDLSGLSQGELIEIATGAKPLPQNTDG